MEEQGTNTYHVAGSASSSGRHVHALKSGDTFGVFDENGDVMHGPGIADGLYHRDTRHLSRFRLTINDAAPLLLSSSLRDNNATLTCDLTNPDFAIADGTIALPHDVIHIRRSRFLFADTCHERIQVRNYSDKAETIEIGIGFGADFTDLFEARGMNRARQGIHQAPVVGDDQVEIGYEGLDRKTRRTRLRFSPTPAHLDGRRATFRLQLAPQKRAVLHVEIACAPTPPVRSAAQNFVFSLLEARRWLRLNSGHATAVSTSNEAFNETIRRAICDLYTLITAKETGPYPYAGVPWYSTAFGRDALITAMFTLWLDPRISQGVLRYLATNQATRYDAAADAEPGKILHEVRHGEMAELGEVPFRHYYGSVDSTPLFVWLAGLYLERTDDVASLRTLWPNIEAALEWIDKDGDRDGDGFVEYGRRNENGLANQGWKDSYDSVFHADGTLAIGPIALVEVQGYVYAARRAGAAIARALGHAERAAGLDSQAERMRSVFEEKFWCEEIDTYAIALDGEKRPCRVRSSNAGHLLMTGLAREDRGRLVGEGLMARRFFTGWGIRTIAAGEPRYNPIAYHNGSVWPHDNAMIAMGLSALSMKVEAERVFVGLVDAAFKVEQRRLPELFCGFVRELGTGPVKYPVACSPQAWAATTIPALVQSILGLSFEPRTRTVRFDRPRLPPLLTEMTLHNLTCGGASGSVHLHRVGNEVAVNVIDRDGGLRVQVTS